VKQAQGVILVSGPLGQGKSTTIAGMLAEHNNVYGPTLKRIALEEPVERKIPGVIQFQAPQWEKDPKKRFGMMLKAFKRHDFNVLFMGEVRDSDGADFSVRFASSGHLFLTTLHARDSILAYTIMHEMVEEGLKFQLVECMSLSVSQRLVKKVCSHCGIKHSPITENELRLFRKNLDLLGEDFEPPKTFTRINTKGCEYCMFGSDGSLPVIELLPFTRKVKDAAHALRRGNDEHARQVMAKARISTLLEEGLKYVNEGLVDLNSVMFL
jgi:type II secretory ATPase GspE/PulE/Tfp pilus assembly ATPase PilB-like protein